MGSISTLLPFNPWKKAITIKISVLSELKCIHRNDRGLWAMFSCTRILQSSETEMDVGSVFMMDLFTIIFLTISFYEVIAFKILFHVSLDFIWVSVGYEQCNKEILKLPLTKRLQYWKINRNFNLK